ncbi:MAG TPA: response regulator [Gaiellaceae bacterium]|nr:response regulator [Gaiellaceae bacterium]
MALRCLIVDDNPRFGDEARSLLEHEGITVVGVAASGNEAARLATALRPDVALVDVSLGAESGFDVARRLVDNEGEPPAVILVSTYDERELTARIESSPALGFVAKAELSAERIRRLLDTSARRER